MISEIIEMPVVRINKNFSKDYEVILYNDDTTPFDFVTGVLMDVFKYSFDKALLLTTNVHEKDRGYVGKYPKKLAESRVNKALSMAEELGFNDFRIEAREEK